MLAICNESTKSELISAWLNWHQEDHELYFYDSSISQLEPIAGDPIVSDSEAPNDSVKLIRVHSIDPYLKINCKRLIRTETDYSFQLRKSIWIDEFDIISIERREDLPSPPIGTPIYLAADLIAKIMGLKKIRNSEI